MENYVLCCPDVQKRRNFTQLRISAHKLQSEIGRYTRPKTPWAERLCLLCNTNSVEDELHFLTECPHFTTERADFCKNMDFTAISS